MDQISGLPDDLLVKISSYVPTKVAVSTCILSKRWEFLWMWSPQLEFISSYVHYEETMLPLRDFIDKKLPLHRAPVIESLRLDLLYTSRIKPKDIKRWIEIAVSRFVRELEIGYYRNNKNILPSSLFTCKSLMTLRLRRVTLMDVPSMACLHSLKTLQLEYMKFINGKSLQQLLSVCPVLEDLSVVFCFNENIKDQFSITVPSLQSLSLFISNSSGYVINTPSLKYLKYEDWSSMRHDSLIKNMPNLREAYVYIQYFNPRSVMGSITSVKHLTICAENLYGDGIVFNQLEHLTLCVCEDDSSSFLGQLLKDSPNLRVLDISAVGDHEVNEFNGMVSWNQPSSVPACLLSSLQIFKWSRYFGRPQDREIAVYILQNACHLKTATFVADITERDSPNLHMIKKLILSSPASSTCELAFVEDLVTFKIIIRT